MDDVNVRSLQQLENLAPFSLEQLQKLAGNLSVRNLKKNEIVFDEGEEARFVYLLLSGVARVSYINGSEKQTIVSLLPAGEFFGFDSLMPKAQHPFRCEAFESGAVGAIKPQSFVETLLGVSYESFLHWYTAAMHSGRKMYIHCVKGIGLDLRRRLALELMNLAERFGTTDKRGVLIVLSVSHEVLAGLMGASRQQVTEHLNELDREKIISRDGRRIIIDVQKLQGVLEPEP